MIINTKGKVSFPGGIHPPQSKNLTLKSEIQPAPAPKQVAIMLSQHIGAVCNPLVKKGDTVQAGQKIGESDAFVSAPVHSPINGTVKEVVLQSHPVLGRVLAVIIDADPENNAPKNIPSGKFTDDFDESSYAAEQICNAISQAGIVGMGGAGFPTRVKLEPNPKMPKETMIINGCECEPYITCDYRLMLEHPNQIIAGIKLAKKASGCKEVFIGIEDNKPEAVKVMADALERGKNSQDISILTLETKYPQGSERQLIRAVLNKQVPTGSIPPMIGVVVLNVATAAAIAQAVACDIPLTHRVVTVTGEGIRNPGNYYAAIGTRVAELIELAGGLTEHAAKILMGGPMMGLAIADLATPTTKTTGAITVLTKKQIGSAKFEGRQTPCIRCGRCLEVCPEHLNPTKIAHAVEHNLPDVAESYYINACMECGCCSYVCPANIEITGYIKTGKIFIAREKKRIPK